MLTLVSALVLNSLAALPPYYESARQIKAVLESREVSQSFQTARSFGAISSITATFEGGYVLTSGRCQVQAKIRFGAIPPGFAGPAPIAGVEAERAVCR